MRSLFVLFISISFSTLIHAQVLGYNDLGIIFSNDTYREGTARSTAMQHAFGALGGDMSAIDINPASAAVFTSSAFSINLGNRNNSISSEYNGSSTLSESGHFNLAQAGFILVYNNDPDTHSDWSRISIGINFDKRDLYNSEWHAKGTGNPTWIYDPDTGLPAYSHNDYQKYSNYSEGSHAVADFVLGARYLDNYYLGVSVNSHSIKYNEASVLKERNHDDNGNYVQAVQKYWVNTQADGISFGVGFIGKTNSGIRYGIAWESPVWYDLTESSNMYAEDENDQEGYYSAYYSQPDDSYENNKDKQLDYEYKMRTPSKLTGSLAYVIGKKGLLSLDFTRKHFPSIRIKPREDFEDENSAFLNDLQDVYQIHAGSEWKFGKFSLRAGAGYENSPYNNAPDSDNTFSYSFGAGYRFGNVSLDIAYDRKSHTGYYDFYPQYEDLPGAELQINTGHILAGFSYSF